MIWGENLSADEVAVTCGCGIAATVEVVDKSGCSRGWYCRQCAETARRQLRRQEKIARAIVRKEKP